MSERSRKIIGLVNGNHKNFSSNSNGIKHHSRNSNIIENCTPPTTRNYDPLAWAKTAAYRNVHPEFDVSRLSDSSQLYSEYNNLVSADTSTPRYRISSVPSVQNYNILEKVGTAANRQFSTPNQIVNSWPRVRTSANINRSQRGVNRTLFNDGGIKQNSRGLSEENVNSSLNILSPVEIKVQRFLQSINQTSEQNVPLQILKPVEYAPNGNQPIHEVPNETIDDVEKLNQILPIPTPSLDSEPIPFIDDLQLWDTIIEFVDVPEEASELIDNIGNLGGEESSNNNSTISREAVFDAAEVDSINDEENSSPVKEKKNWYLKDTYCIHCKTSIKSHFSRHLTTHHHDQEEVAEVKKLQFKCLHHANIIKAFNNLKKEGLFDKLSEAEKKIKEDEFKEAKARWRDLNKSVRAITEKLRKEGAYKFNIAQPLGEEIMVKKRPNNGKYKPTILTHATCSHCFYTGLRENLYEHVKICGNNPHNSKNDDKIESDNETEEERKARCRVRVLRSSAQLLLFKSKEDFDLVHNIYEEVILKNMKNDMTTLIVRTDPLLLEVGVRLFTNHREKKCHNKIRSELRDLARLYLLSEEEDENISCFEDCINPKKFKMLINAIQQLAAYDVNTGEIGVVGISGRYQGPLKLCADAIWSRMILNEDYTPEVKEATRIKLSEFRHLMTFEWKFQIGTNCEKSQKKRHALKQDLIPLDEDIQFLSEKLTESYQQLISNLERTPDLNTFEKLSKVVIGDLELFNRKRPSEITYTTMHQYSLKTKESDQTPDEDILSEEEKHASENLSVYFVPGKNNKQVPILLTPQMEAGIECLIACRSTLNVPSAGEDLLFQRKNSNGEWARYDGSLVLSDFVKKYRKFLKKPDHITCTGLRHHIATDTQLHPHSTAYVDNLCDFMGHTRGVHNRNYRLPVSLIFRAQIGARLLKFRQRVGKNADESRLEVARVDSSEENRHEPGDLPNFQTADDESLTARSEEMNISSSPQTTSGASNGAKEYEILSNDESHNESILRPSRKRLNEVFESESEIELEHRQPKKRPRWTAEQKAIIYKYFGDIMKTNVPTRQEILAMYQNEKLLQVRPFISVYIYIHNQLKNSKKSRN